MAIGGNKVVALASADLDGLNIMPNAQVSVLLLGVAAVIYEDVGATTPLSNPATCDRNGELFFYAEEGDYTIKVGNGEYWPLRIST